MSVWTRWLKGIAEIVVSEEYSVQFSLFLCALFSELLAN